MNKLIAIVFVVLHLFCTSNVFAQEIVTGFDQNDLAILNEELRRLRKDVGTNTTSLETALPAGCIVMWSGAIADIPSGYALCDGENGTPDLTDRFIIHADADSGGTNDVGDTGGSHTVTISEAQLPAHVHTINHGHSLSHAIYAPSGATGGNSLAGFRETTQITVNDYNGNSGSVGSGDSVTITPKYYALAFIQKL